MRRKGFYRRTYQFHCSWHQDVLPHLVVGYLQNPDVARLNSCSTNLQTGCSGLLEVPPRCASLARSRPGPQDEHHRSHAGPGEPISCEHSRQRAVNTACTQGARQPVGNGYRCEQHRRGGSRPTGQLFVDRVEPCKEHSEYRRNLHCKNNTRSL
jgi:hypothetical protein